MPDRCDSRWRRSGLRTGKRTRVEMRIAGCQARADTRGDQCVGDFPQLHRALLGG